MPFSEEYFISLVEARRPLWDKTDKNYKNQNVKQKLWTDIGNLCNITHEEACSLFSSFRLKYVRRRKEIENMSLSGEAKILKPWSLQERLRFLDHTITQRNTVSKIMQYARRQSTKEQWVSEQADDTKDQLIQNQSRPISSNALEEAIVEPSEEMDNNGMSGILSDESLLSAAVDGSISQSPVPQSIQLATFRPTASSTVGQKRKADDDLDKIVAAISAPVQIEAPVWTVSERVKNYCRFLSYRLDQLPSNKLTQAEIIILSIINDIENE